MIPGLPKRKRENTMNKTKTTLETQLIEALEALPSNKKMQETLIELKKHNIPDNDDARVIEFILILLQEHPELQSTHPQAQPLMKLHKECLKRAKSAQESLSNFNIKHP